MSRWRPSFTVWSLIALALGFGGGLLAHELRSAPLLAAAAAIGPIGTLWTNLLQMTVIPLVLVNLMLGVAGGDPRAVGRLGGLSLLTFVGMLALGSVVAALAVPAILSMVPAGAMSLAGPGSGAPPPQGGPPLSFVRWLIALVPVNPFHAASEGEILPLIVFTVPFALALTRIRADLRRSLLDVVRAIAEALFVMLRWILWITPIGVFCLTFSISSQTGPSSAGAVAIFVVMVCGLLIAFTLLLYPLAAALGRVSIVRFAQAAVPAQVVAVSTRSSLASLPALVEGAERHLRLPRSVTGLVLPLAVAMFKVNQPVSSTAKMLFLAHVYRVPLEPVQILTFAATVMLLSFSVAGIPSTGSHSTIPLYLAFGIPIEGVVILSAVDALPDVFKTLANVTADMAAATIVARAGGSKAAPPLEAMEAEG